MNYARESFKKHIEKLKEVKKLGFESNDAVCRTLKTLKENKNINYVYNPLQEDLRFYSKEIVDDNGANVTFKDKYGVTTKQCFEFKKNGLLDQIPNYTKTYNYPKYFSLRYDKEFRNYGLNIFTDYVPFSFNSEYSVDKDGLQINEYATQKCLSDTWKKSNDEYMKHNSWVRCLEILPYNLEFYPCSKSKVKNRTCGNEYNEFATFINWFYMIYNNFVNFVTYLDTYLDITLKIQTDSKGNKYFNFGTFKYALNYLIDDTVANQIIVGDCYMYSIHPQKSDDLAHCLYDFCNNDFESIEDEIFEKYCIPESLKVGSSKRLHKRIRRILNGETIVTSKMLIDTICKTKGITKSDLSDIIRKQEETQLLLKQQYIGLEFPNLWEVWDALYRK